MVLIVHHLDDHRLLHVKNLLIHRMVFKLLHLFSRIDAVNGHQPIKQKSKLNKVQSSPTLMKHLFREIPTSPIVSMSIKVGCRIGIHKCNQLISHKIFVNSFIKSFLFQIKNSFIFLALSFDDIPTKTQQLTYRLSTVVGR